MAPRNAPDFGEWAARVLGPAASRLGLVSITLTLSAAASPLLLGFLADRVNRVTMLIGSLIYASLAFASTWLVHDVNGVLIIVVFAGIGVAEMAQTIASESVFGERARAAKPARLGHGRICVHGDAQRHVGELSCRRAVRRTRVHRAVPVSRGIEPGVRHRRRYPCKVAARRQDARRRTTKSGDLTRLRLRPAYLVEESLRGAESANIFHEDACDAFAGVGVPRPTIVRRDKQVRRTP